MGRFQLFRRPLEPVLSDELATTLSASLGDGSIYQLTEDEQIGRLAERAAAVNGPDRASDPQLNVLAGVVLQLSVLEQTWKELAGTNVISVDGLSRSCRPRQPRQAPAHDWREGDDGPAPGEAQRLDSLDGSGRASGRPVTHYQRTSRSGSSRCENWPHSRRWRPLRL